VLLYTPLVFAAPRVACEVERLCHQRPLPWASLPVVLPASATPARARTAGSAARIVPRVRRGPGAGDPRAGQPRLRRRDRAAPGGRRAPCRQARRPRRGRRRAGAGGVPGRRLCPAESWLPLVAPCGTRSWWWPGTLMTQPRYAAALRSSPGCVSFPMALLIAALLLPARAALARPCDRRHWYRADRRRAADTGAAGHPSAALGPRPPSPAC
jgi:hypothetical protein